MCSSHHQPLRFEIKPAHDSEPSLFNLSLLYREGGDWQHYLNVHIPTAIWPHIEIGAVDVVHLETIPRNQRASAAIGPLVLHAITAARLKDGTVVNAVPRQWRQAWLRGSVRGAIVAALGVGVLFSAAPIVGACLIVVGTHDFRSAWAIPHSRAEFI